MVEIYKIVLPLSTAKWRSGYIILSAFWKLSGWLE